MNSLTKVLLEDLLEAEKKKVTAIYGGGFKPPTKGHYAVIEKAYGTKMPIRVSDFKAIEAAILKNNAFNEFDKLSEVAKKQHPKSMLSDYYKGMFYEKTGVFKKGAKAYQNAFNKEEIGDLTKELMLDKADQLKNQ